MYGMDEFSAVINPPQAAILAVGGGIKKVVPGAYCEQSGARSAPTVATTMTVSLSSDTRVVTPAASAKFLQVFGMYMKDPHSLML